MAMVKAQSITVAEFKETLLKSRPQKDVKWPYAIGLAVSGGVDSMCLAGLAASLQNEQPKTWSFKAVVVDHKARSGSTEEAYTIKQWLEKRGEAFMKPYNKSYPIDSAKGLPTSVVELQWPKGVEALRLSNFETEARKLRYRALGLECHKLGISELLTGHHSDDQAETVLSRMIQGYTGSGLAGIAAETPVPECFGYYGIHNTKGGRAKQHQVRVGGRPMMLERPLLQYSKDQLRATCQELQMDWKEDETNSDPTLTVRNAVRHLLKKNLPVALKRESLLSLSKSIAQKKQALREGAENLLKKITFAIFDLRSGAMRIRIPLQVFMKHLENNNLDREREVATAMVLIADAVSPTEAMGMRQGFIISDKIFQTTTHHKSFTVGDVYFFNEGVGPDLSSNWTLCRRPTPRRGLKNFVGRSQPSLLWSKESHLTSVHQEVQASQTTFGNWQLFDGRFWIKVWTTSNDYDSLKIRPMTVEDMEHVKLRLSKDARRSKRLRSRMNSAAPGTVIPQTLPVLVEESSGIVLALPSIGMYASLDPKVRKHIFWEVNFKWTELYSKERGKVNHDQSFDLRKLLKDRPHWIQNLPKALKSGAVLTKNEYDWG